PGGPTPPPPGAGGYPPGPGGPGGPPPKKSRLPLVLALGVVAVVLIAAVAVIGLTVAGGGSPEPGTQVVAAARAGSERAEARTALITAVTEGDAEAVSTLAVEAPAVVADATPAALGEAVTAPLGPTGLAVLTFDAVAGESYTVVVEGDAEVATAALAPEGGAPIAPATTIAADADGAYRLLLVAEDGGDEVTVTVDLIEVTPVDLSADELLEGEIAEEGDVVAYEVEATAGSHYVVDIDEPDLAVTVVGPDGATVPTEPDVDLGTPRFVAEADGPHRVLIGSGEDGTTGAFSIELFEVAEFFFYYDEESVPGLTLERTTEEFQAPIDQEAQRAHFCLFLREGVRIILTIRVTSATLDMGIDVYDETDSGPLVARVNSNGPGITEQWSGTASEDLRRCFQLWAVDFTSGQFIVDFESEIR
ncbi:MAG TPA: hypothetical protein VFU19_14155, partial [Iamia sp.]|nr:hypothetical protein [Iamia sp.]